MKDTLLSETPIRVLVGMVGQLSVDCLFLLGMMERQVSPEEEDESEVYPGARREDESELDHRCLAELPL